MNVGAGVRDSISKNLQVPASQLTPDVPFRSLPNVDSMRLLNIVLEVETLFEIELPDDVTFRVSTIGEFEKLVGDLCGQEPPR